MAVQAGLRRSERVAAKAAKPAGVDEKKAAARVVRTGELRSAIIASALESCASEPEKQHWAARWALVSKAWADDVERHRYVDVKADIDEDSLLGRTTHILGALLDKPSRCQGVRTLCIDSDPDTMYGDGTSGDHTYQLAMDCARARLRALNQHCTGLQSLEISSWFFYGRPQPQFTLGSPEMWLDLPSWTLTLVELHLNHFIEPTIWLILQSMPSLRLLDLSFQVSSVWAMDLYESRSRVMKLPALQYLRCMLDVPQSSETDEERLSTWLWHGDFLKVLLDAIGPTVQEVSLCLWHRQLYVDLMMNWTLPCLRRLTVFYKYRALDYGPLPPLWEGELHADEWYGMPCPTECFSLHIESDEGALEDTQAWLQSLTARSRTSFPRCIIDIGDSWKRASAARCLELDDALTACVVGLCQRGGTVNILTCELSASPLIAAAMANSSCTAISSDGISATSGPKAIALPKLLEVLDGCVQGVGGYMTTSKTDAELFFTGSTHH